MARNEEKAQSMLNRLLTSKQREERGPKAKRPYLATECHDLNEADKWRQQILREIGRKVMEIQNAGLGDHRLVTALIVASQGCIVDRHRVARALVEHDRVAVVYVQDTGLERRD